MFFETTYLCIYHKHLVIVIYLFEYLPKVNHPFKSTGHLAKDQYSHLVYPNIMQKKKKKKRKKHLLQFGLIDVAIE